MNFEIAGGVPDGYKAISFRKVKHNEIYLVMGRQKNYAMKWSSRSQSLDERIILKKIKPVDDKC